MLRILVLMAASLALTGCAQLTLAWADLAPKDRPAEPNILGPFEGLTFVGLTGSAQSTTPATPVERWETQLNPFYRAGLETHVYGRMPDDSETTLISRRVLNEAAFDGTGVLEELELTATADFSGRKVTTGFGDNKPFYVELILPKNAAGPVPVIVMETFCSRWSAVPDPAVTGPEERGNGGPLSGLMLYTFGRYICVPPYADILSAGYAVAVIYPNEVLPDASERGMAELARMSSGMVDDESRWGSIGAWGWLFSRVIDILETDERLDNDAMVVWGHSRYGKAALVAAAYDERIDGVVSHQSGTGGASLNRKKPGESIASITKNYPHWFAKRYASYGDSAEDMPVDQHMLLGLIAPRPVLLGNARRDVWSDPNGAFRAAQGANPAYALFGSQGLTSEKLNDYRPADDIAYWIRPGTHGVVEEDWPAFTAFLEAHFPARPPLAMR